MNETKENWAILKACVREAAKELFFLMVRPFFGFFFKLQESSFFLVVQPLPSPPLSGPTTKKDFFAASLRRANKLMVNNMQAMYTQSKHKLAYFWLQKKNFLLLDILSLIQPKTTFFFDRICIYKKKG